MVATHGAQANEYKRLSPLAARASDSAAGSQTMKAPSPARRRAAHGEAQTTGRGQTEQPEHQARHRALYGSNGHRAEDDGLHRFVYRVNSRFIS